MNILSICDGISCGMIALERAGIKVTNYYASEIDPYAIKISQKNYPKIIRLGNMTDWKNWDIPKPDMIISGTPCQGFSFAGKGLNFDDPRSKLFLVLHDILKHYKPKQFLLENVIMSAQSNDVISSMLGDLYPECIEQGQLFKAGRLEPIRINSALVSAQNRERLYWTNIQGITQPEDRGILLKDIITADRFDMRNKIGKNLTKTNVNKSQSILARDYKGIGNFQSSVVVVHGDNWRRPTPQEYERLQTVPDGYTEGVSNTRRYHALGNGWTVDIIAWIFTFIPKHML